MKVLILRKRSEKLQKLEDYINNFLNPSKVNFFDPSRDNFTEVKSVSEVLKELDISVEEYENAFKISDDNGPPIHVLLITIFILVCLHGKLT